MSHRKQMIRDSYAAFAAAERSFFEQRLSEDFVFSAPPDPKLDRDGYYERCWPGSGRGQDFEIVRMIESGDEVIVTYETDTSSGARGRKPRSSRLVARLAVASVKLKQIKPNCRL